MTSEDLLNTLQDLSVDEFDSFRWYLRQTDTLVGYEPIRACKLEVADRRAAVDLMKNAYGLHGALTVTKKILEKIPRNDLVQSLSDSTSAPGGQSLSFLLFVSSDRNGGLTKQYV